MSLVPRSSLRSLALLVSHGKPGLSSFFSSTATFAPQAAPRGDSPVAPVVLSSEDPMYDITVDPKGLCNTFQPEIDKQPSPGAIKDPNGTVPEGSESTLVPEQPIKDPDHHVPEGPNSERPPIPILKDPDHVVPEGPNNG